MKQSVSLCLGLDYVFVFFFSDIKASKNLFIYLILAKLVKDQK